MNEIPETARESLATLQHGLIEEVDAAKARVKVKIPALDDMVTHWLQWPVASSLENRSYELPDTGTLVSLLLDVQGVEGAIIGALYSEADPPPVTSAAKWHKVFKDGTTLEYDRDSHTLTVDAKGEITIKTTGPVTIEAGPASTLTLKALQVKVQATAAIELDAPITTTNNLLVKGKLAFNPI